MKVSSFVVGVVLLLLALLIASPLARVYFVRCLIGGGAYYVSLSEPAIEGYTFEARVLALGLGRMKEPQNRTAAELRAKMDLLWYASAINPAASVKAFQTQKTKLTVYSVTPKNLFSDIIIIYCHGGYHVAGSWLSHGGYVSEIAVKLGGVIYFPEFRLAPEHPLPAATLDIVELYEELLQSYNNKQIFIAGDSAGGGQVALSMLKLRQLGLPLPQGGWMISPFTDFTWSSPSVEYNKKYDKMIGDDVVTPFAPQCMAMGLPTDCHHTIDRSRFKDPQYSPLFADLNGLPPLYIQVSKHERLYDDARLFAEKATEQGIDVTFKAYPYQQHVFHIFCPYVPEACAAIDDAVTWITKLK